MLDVLRDIMTGSRTLTPLVIVLVRTVSEYIWGNPELERLRRYEEMEVISTSTKRARDLDDSRCPLNLICLRGFKLADRARILLAARSISSSASRASDR
jgi:hypothetical protein